MSAHQPSIDGNTRYVKRKNMKRIALLVDDEAAILTTLSAILERQGLEIHTARSANAAMEKLRGIVAFDLVITDLKMEHDRAGYDVVDAAKTLPRPPIAIILSSYSSLSRDWEERGAHAAFDKPVDIHELLRAINVLLNQRDEGELNQPESQSHDPLRYGT